MDEITVYWVETPAMYCAYFDPEGHLAYGKKPREAVRQLLDWDWVYDETETGGEMRQWFNALMCAVGLHKDKTFNSGLYRYCRHCGRAQGMGLQSGRWEDL